MKIDQVVRKGILDIASYVPGKPIEEVQRELGIEHLTKLASNENMLGPSPKAIEAIQKELPSIYFYPEPACTLLRQALARKFSLPEENLVISNGADNLILLIANAFVNEGDEVVMADPTFPVYTNATQIMGGKVVKVKLRNNTHDLPAMLGRVRRRTKLVFVCNPNNPTGTIVTRRALDRFLSRLPEHVIPILDEAYGDFVDRTDYPDGLGYVKKERPIIVLRTFSKVYGLAGLRIGYAMGSKDLIDCLYRVREPFPVHRLGQAGAVAALEDRAHVKKSIRMVLEGRKYLYRELDKMGLSYVPSQANFIFMDLGKDSREAHEELLREGIIIRPGYIWGYPTFARVTVGRLEDNRKFIKALRKILKE